MTFVDLGMNIVIPRTPVGSGGAQSITTTTLNTANEKISFIVQAPATGNIKSVRFLATVVTSAGTGTVTLETVDYTSLPSKPSGTLVNVNATVGVDVTTAAEILATFPSVIAVTAGQFIAVTITNSTGNWRIGFMQREEDCNFPLIVNNTSGAFAAASGAPILTFLYEGSPDIYRVPVGCYSNAGLTNVSFNTGSNPNYIGNVIQTAVPMKAIGAWAWMDNDQACDIVIATKDYNYSPESGVLSKVTTSPSNRSSNQARILIYQFPDTVTLEANTKYRLFVKPSSASNSVIYRYNYASVALLNASSQGNDSGNLIVKATQSSNPVNDAGWTDSSTSVYTIGLLVNSIDTGTSGGEISTAFFV